MPTLDRRVLPAGIRNTMHRPVLIDRKIEEDFGRLPPPSRYHVALTLAERLLPLVILLRGSQPEFRSATVNRKTSVPDEVVVDSRLERLRSFTRIMDDSFRIPGTRFRVGLDPLLGLVPGAGDVVGAVLAGAIVIEAVRRRVPGPTLVRMALNIAIDTGIGTVPVVGDVFDAVWKANRKNLELLERHVHRRPVERAASFVAIALTRILLVLLAIGVTTGVAFLLVRLLAGQS